MPGAKMIIIEIAAGLFIASWLFNAFNSTAEFIETLPPGRSFKPGEWKDGVRNIALCLVAAAALYYLA
jgi:hypothetical protein